LHLSQEQAQNMGVASLMQVKGAATAPR